MDPLYLKAILAGFCFGLWPLFMNKSGLNSVEASVALSLFLLAVVTPFLLVNGFQQLSTIRWQMALPSECSSMSVSVITLSSSPRLEICCTREGSRCCAQSGAGTGRAQHRRGCANISFPEATRLHSQRFCHP